MEEKTHPLVNFWEEEMDSSRFSTCPKQRVALTTHWLYQSNLTVIMQTKKNICYTLVYQKESDSETIFGISPILCVFEGYF